MESLKCTLSFQHQFEQCRLGTLHSCRPMQLKQKARKAERDGNAKASLNVNFFISVAREYLTVQLLCLMFKRSLLKAVSLLSITYHVV